MSLRKNSKAKGWIGRKIAQLNREGYPSKQAKAIALSEARKHGLIKNPSDEAELQEELGTEEQAEEVARGFHGRENRESYDFEVEEPYRENLACLGPMLDVEVFIEARAEDGLVTLPFEDVVLTCSPDRKQLYLVGDTSLPDDWLEQSSPNSWQKDKVPIGWIYSISYFADKHHLTGSKQQKNGAEYIHCFGEQTFPGGGRKKIHKLNEKIGAGLLPILVYNRLGGGMELVGGGYVVKDEGIWD
jgi:hypothetical protein